MDSPIILRRAHHRVSRKDIDPDALKIIYRLHRHGFIAYLCGGAVRDLMLGRIPKDFDIVTDARPGQIKKRFANVYVIGRRFRLAHVHFPGNKIIEVSTFRKNTVGRDFDKEEGPPDPASLYGTPDEDAFRRDLTINALYYDAISFDIIDYVGGLEDMALRRIRVIGNPDDRFTEDPVRIWRVIRHAARLGFDIDEATARAIPSHKHLIAACPGARLYEELNKDLLNGSRSVLSGLKSHGLLGLVLGDIGHYYESDREMSLRLEALLDVKDKAISSGASFSKEEVYALLFRPWAECVLEQSRGDMNQYLHEAFAEAHVQATLPRTLRTDVFQILIIAESLLQALRTGRMRWSLSRKDHFPQAVRLAFLFQTGRLPEEDESFEKLFHEAHPTLPAGGFRKKRRRRRKKKNGTSGPPLQA